MEIRATSNYDMAAMRALSYLIMFKKENPRKRMKLWTTFFAVLAAFIILEMILLGVDTVLLILLGLSVLWVILLHLWYALYPKIQYNSMAKMKDAHNEYIFWENQLKASTKSEEYTGEAEIEYSLFLKVYETSDYFFLFQTKNQLYAVDKKTVENGTVEELRTHLQSKIKNYIVCKY